MIQVVHRRRYKATGYVEDRTEKFKTLRHARSFMRKLTPGYRRRDLYGNAVVDSHPRLVH